METAAFAARHWMPTALEKVRDGVIAVNVDGTILFMNHSARQLTGHCHPAARDLSSVFVLDRHSDPAANDPDLRAALKSGTCLSASDRRLVRADNSLLPVDFSLLPVCENNKVLGAVLVFFEHGHAAPVKTPAATVPDPPFRRRVLVMDDDDLVRTMTVQKLMRLGYAADSAEDGEEAVSKFKTAKKENRPYDVVVLDLIVRGGMGGKETVALLKRIDPDVRAVLTSGHAMDPVLTNYWEYGFAAVVRKPFVIKELDIAIRRALAVAGEGA